MKNDWRLQIPEERRARFRIWFWSIAAMTLGVLIVGGITRLTQSGLSIVDWDPVMGVIPPMNEAEWQAAFDRYRQFPEYQKLRRGMPLAEFKFIFFWEYLHRVLARAIGLVFLIPFVYFAVRRWFTRPLAYRAVGLFLLGAGQGLMGWYMVASGLVDRPSVSHYRLAAHLSLAFVIFGASVWLARELKITADRTAVPHAVRRTVRHGLLWVGGLFGAQVVWGAFVAGLKAGRYHNTFPLMEGTLWPSSMLWLEPAILNFVQNPIAVQWTHRVLGTVLALVVIAFWLRLRRIDADPADRRYGAAFLALIGVQYLLGVLTLIYFVPVSLAIAHQALAMIMFGVWVAWWHHARNLRTTDAPDREPALAAAAA